MGSAAIAGKVVEATPPALKGPLSVLQPCEVNALLDSAVRRTYGPGDVLIREGDRNDDVYVLLEGRIRVVCSAEDGREIMVALFGPGDTLGELAAFDAAPRCATISALEDVTTLMIPGQAFLTFLRERPHLMLAVLKLLARRVRELDRRLVEARAEDTLTRLARQLLEIGAKYGVPTPEGLRLDVPMSQEHLASWVGSSREAISVALRTLRERRAVVTGRMSITLIDIDELREVAHG